MKVLWLCGLPLEIQEHAFGGEPLGAHSAWSWIVGHLPPPTDVDLHIACPITRGRLQNRSVRYKGATIHLIRCLPGRLQCGYLLDPLFFAPFIRKLNPDIVHAWGTEDGCNMTAECVAPKKHVVQIQGVVNKIRMLKPVGKRGRHYVAYRERRTVKRAHTVFCESEYSKRLVSPYAGKAAHITVVDHPLRPPFLQAEAGDPECSHILFLGRLCAQKGYKDALKAFASAAPESWSMTLAGGAAPAVLSEMNALIMDLGVQERVAHIPQLDCEELVECMRGSSVFLLPSKQDTGPTALKEALAMGLWPVCYDNAGPREYITRFDYGSLARTDDVDDLTAVLAGALKDRPWLSEDRREKAMSRVRRELSADVIWKQLLVYYARLI